jgi:hypothetical protein
MPRPRKEISQHIQQQAQSLQSETGAEAEATARDIAAEAAELAAGPDLTALLDQLADLAGKARHHCEMDRGPWLQTQLLSLINQLKAAL